MSTKTPKSEITWMPEARQIAAQCWCDPETSGIQMDTRLAEACAQRIASWMEEAARQASGVDYYRGLLSECGAAIGKEAYTQDDGGVVPDVLAAKVPELVKRLATELSRVTEERDAALRRVEELEGLATGNECHADGGTWFEVFVSDDRLGGTETEGDECPTLGKVFPARLDAAEKGERS